MLEENSSKPRTNSKISYVKYKVAKSRLNGIILGTFRSFNKKRGKKQKMFNKFKSLREYSS